LGVLKMEDLEIIKQLYFGNHLEEKDLTRARIILKQLDVPLCHRVIK